ncbi:MAG: hypothetical protein INQ03_21215 [Candidatus Heimdallarchaeota archaeon]|nr:hypothetical protein [Candidatus Heimdallarchaeota archaeon]
MKGKLIFKKLRSLLVLVLVLSMLTSASGNIIDPLLNGSFEDGNGQIPYYWELEDDDTDHQYRTTDDSHTGEYSMKILSLGWI